jgi:Family of unknown function (DUF6345)
MAMRLPVYSLSVAPGSAEKLGHIAATAFGAKRLKFEERDGRVVGRSGSVVAEADRPGGGMWAADERRLWSPLQRPSLVRAKTAYSRARKLLTELELLPSFDREPFAVVELGAGRTRIATRTRGKRTNRALDVQARFGVAVRNPGVEGEPQLLPVVGGGGKFKLTLGDKGRPIAYQGLWRPVGEEESVEAIERAEARARFDELTVELEVEDVRSFLAYYAAPTGEKQALLTPVWVFGGTIVAKGTRVPMRLVTIAATERGPNPPKQKRQPKRRKQPGRITLEPPRAKRARHHNPLEAGTSWIGLSGGLSGSQANAKGFVDGLKADGWSINFNWGDANAWESDWRRNDDTWVDAADFVFYTGHASMDGWTLASPDDGSLTFNEVGAAPAAPGDLWGQQDLEWIVIAACGPLQDKVLASGGGDVLARWDGAFDGLHTLMGYGAITFDNTDEGKRIVKYARGGTPLIDAWFRTAQEIQPSTNGADPPDGPDVWVGAMYVTKQAANPRSDHLWGHGSVSKDPTSPSGLVCMWTTC